MRAIEQMSQIRVVRRFTAAAGIRLQGGRSATGDPASRNDEISSAAKGFTRRACTSSVGDRFHTRDASTAMYFSMCSSIFRDTEVELSRSENPLETDMKRKPSNVPIPLQDFRPALLGAVSWLGDRHLLAEPMPRLNEGHSAYFAESPRWHPAVIAGAIAKFS